MRPNFPLVLTLAALLAGHPGAQAQTQIQTQNHPETVTTFTNGHCYTLTLQGNKATAFSIDNKRVSDTDLPKYDSLITALVTDIRRDEAQAEEDRKQAKKDREQADRDREQADRDRLQADKDREQARHDQAQAGHDREQADKDRAQAVKDREQAEKDRAQAAKDREQADKDREQAAKDRAQAALERQMMQDIIQYVVDQKLVPNAESLKSLSLTDDALTVNGTKAPGTAHQALKTKYPGWAHRGLNYCNKDDAGNTIRYFNIGSAKSSSN